MASILHDGSQEAIRVPHFDDEPESVIRMLHVDNEPDQLMFTKRFLEEADTAIQVESVLSPEEAQHMLHQQSFDCVVSDYAMPGMDGINLARRVREKSQIPFILYTGKGSEEVARAAFAAGIDDYIRKEHDPSHYQVLAKRVRTAVEKHRAEEARRESGEKYRKLFDEALDAIFVAEAETGLIIDCNRAACELVGREKSELIGKHQRILHPPETIEGGFSRTFKQHLKEKEGQVLETQVITKKGEIKEVAIKANLFELGSKKLIQGIFRDITARKQFVAKMLSLHRHAAELSTAEDIENIVESTFDAIKQVLGFDRGGFGVVDGGFLHFIHIMGVKKDEVYEMPLDGSGVTIRAVRLGETQLVHDTREDEDFVIGIREGFSESLSELAVPVKVEREVVAVINIESNKLDAFTEEDQRLLETLALHVASAMERLRHIEMLRASEERFRTLLDESMDGIAVLVGTRIVYANKRLTELIGLSNPSEVIGRDALDFIASDDREIVRTSALGRQRGEERPELYEYKMLRADGTKIDIETYATKIEYEGKPASLALNRDITERKKAEETLRRSEEQARHLLEFQNKVIDTAIVWIDLLDEEGNVTLWNRAAELISGYSREEVIGHKKIWERLYPDPDYRAKILEEAKNIIKGERVENFETTIRCKDGSSKTILWYDSNILDEKGKPVGSIAVGIDITESKQAEQKLLEYADHLEYMVDEKTRELLDAERLVAAGRVASMVGHDLRGPLQTIKNAVYLLKRAPEEAEETLEMIEDTVDRAVRMLEEFRHKTRDSPLNVVTIDLEELIQVAVKEADIPDSMDVSLELGDGLDTVSLDPMKIRRVLDNLIRNSVEAMPNGGDLTVIAGMRDDEIVIKVVDTGVGIPEEKMSNLFELFHTTKPKGMGLGLAYCKRAVEAHGGTISVESKAGEGTTFTVTLPTDKSCTSNNP